MKTKTKLQCLAAILLLCGTVLWLNNRPTVIDPHAPQQLSDASAPAAQDTPVTPIQATADLSEAAAAPKQAWVLPARVEGHKLNPDTPANNHDHGHDHDHGQVPEGRHVKVDPASLLAVDEIKKGDTVVFPLFAGHSVTGKANLVTSDEGGWIRVGGTLNDQGGSFYLSTDGKETVATVMVPSEKLAYEMAPQDDGSLLFKETRLAEVVCFPLPREPNSSERTLLQSSAAAPLAAPPVLSSRPSATAVFYLDFDGAVVTDPLWAGGQTINAAAINFTNEQITEIWRRVSEDFAPFNVDITTDASRYDQAAVGNRMRCIFTPNDAAAPGAGGVAYLRSFDRAGTGSFTTTIPCWVFNQSVDGATEAATHEIGHTLGLSHDGTATRDYYSGHGTGAVSWGPIMGASYNRSLTQWSKGEYASANQQQDDIAIIANTANGFGFIPDNAGNTLATATALNAPGGTVNQSGTILTQSDVDYFSFSTGGGSVVINANSPATKPNLDLSLQLLNSSGTVLSQSNPDTAINASLNVSVAAGTYYLKLQGTGRGDPLGDGYTSYGSIGPYRLTGTIPGASVQNPPVVSSSSTATGTVNTAFSYQIVASNTPTSYGVTGALPSGLTLNTTSGLISGNPGAAGSFPVTISATNAAGTGTKALTITINQVVGTLTLATALDASGLTWTTGGNANWFPQASVTADGVDAASSGDIGNSQTSWVETTITGPATVTFRWKVSSESGYDFFRLLVNGTSVITPISGERNWTFVTYKIPGSAAYTLRWSYSKDGSVSSGADTAWLDTITVTR